MKFQLVVPATLRAPFQPLPFLSDSGYFCPSPGLLPNCQLGSLTVPGMKFQLVVPATLRAPFQPLPFLSDSGYFCPSPGLLPNCQLGSLLSLAVDLGL